MNFKGILFLLSRVLLGLTFCIPEIPSSPFFILTPLLSLPFLFSETKQKNRPKKQKKRNAKTETPLFVQQNVLLMVLVCL